MLAGALVATLLFRAALSTAQTVNADHACESGLHTDPGWRCTRRRVQELVA
jgi:hypothetical protein